MSQDVQILKSSTKENFIHTLFEAGKARLEIGDRTGIELFETVSELAPDDHLLFHEQGIALFDFASKSHTKTLLTANQKFKQATKLEPRFFESWLSWGNSLFVLGLRLGDFHYFLNAKEKFERALCLSKGEKTEYLVDLNWNYGLTMAHIASKSEDPADLQLAYSALSQASLSPKELTYRFWTDFGHIAMRLFNTLGTLKYLEDAICHYRQAKNYICLGEALASLYHMTCEPEHYEQASECFAKSVGTDPTAWLQWASLMISAGRQENDPKALHAALEKCHKAKALQADPLELACVWAEAHAALGSIQGRLKHLKRAEKILEPLADQYPAEPYLQFAYGTTLLALGDYFQCLDLYYQAIEAFQKATSIDRTFHAAWHALGTTYQIIAPMEEDSKLQLKRAVRFFGKALKLRPEPAYHFDLGHALYLLADETLDTHLIDRSLYHIETALDHQKNATYVHSNWLYSHACALTLSGELHHNEDNFNRSLDTLHELLMVDPTHHDLHYRFALTYNAYADEKDDPLLFERAFHHFRIARDRAPDKDEILVDWAISLIHLHEIEPNPCHLNDAEHKLIQAARLGNINAYYTLAGLYALQQKTDHALHNLKQAQKYSALPPVSEVIDDEWLEALHALPAFQEFIAIISLEK